MATCQVKAPLSDKGPLLAAENSFSLGPYSKRSLSKGLFVGVETRVILLGSKSEPT